MKDALVQLRLSLKLLPFDLSRSMLRQSHVDMTMHYLHNSHKARDAQAQFIERFLPNGGTVADVGEPTDEKRVPVRVQ
jgi:hypothetical protein